MGEGVLVVKLDAGEEQRIWEGYHLELYRIICLAGSGTIKTRDREGNPREVRIGADRGCDVLGTPIDIVAGAHGIEVECTRLPK